MSRGPGGEAGAVTMVFAVTGMHCASCGLLVDDVVEDLAGVARSATDVTAGRTVVTLAEGAAVEPSAVAQAIAEIGYSARPTEPDPTPGGVG
jgi:copper chaperone